MGAVVTGIGGIGSIAGVWAYVATDAGSGYHKGNSFNLAMAASLCVTAIGLFLYQKRENVHRAKGGRDYRLEKGDVEMCVPLVSPLKPSRLIECSIRLGNLHPSFKFIH